MTQDTLTKIAKELQRTFSGLSHTEALLVALRIDDILHADTAVDRLHPIRESFVIGPPTDRPSTLNPSKEPL